ncbi:GAF domain-containing protein [Humidesulfovibrio mexicanus]|uniref:GAF domain-containing protein n=2 Tax=Humidesulfovibrio mexicanus TaxID=147047 RepID=A0A238YUQ6_9BACT|nr:GAF domain-containing protein [Humidesulfovibrio mexicanus]
MEYMDRKPYDIVREILKVIEELNTLKDVDAILDKVLEEARAMTMADAGSIFLVEGEALRFRYVHNDTLFTATEASRQIYTDYSLPINDKSIVGYAAMTGEIVNIPDAYSLGGDEPYSFNKNLDQETGYRTRSMLTLPLKTFQNKIVGVMQLINAKDREGQPEPFSEYALQYAPLFANSASVTIERGIMTREIMLRMMKMAEMRDPKETGAHVLRVGAYSAEVYQQWAKRKGVDDLTIKRRKDTLRLAAMLHDVGKVGIADAILKKPGRLTPEEFALMKWHSIYGAALFANTTSELDQLCREIALRHHERWDGTGYPGRLPDDLSQVRELCVAPLSGEDIPIAARITALADVYDALISTRAYKDAWPEDKVIEEILRSRGTQFDPEVVDAFMEIQDVIRAIRAKYQED